MLKKSLALRIFVLNLIFIIFPATTYFFLFFQWEYEKKIQVVIDRLHDIGLSKASYLEQMIKDKYITLDVMEEMADLRLKSSFENLDALKPTLNRIGKYINYGLFVKYDKHFIIKYISSPLQQYYENKDLTYRAYLYTAFQNNYAVYLAYDYLLKKKDFVFAKAIRNRDDFSFLGVLACWTDAIPILEKILKSEYLADKESISLLSEDKIVFESSDPAFYSLAFAPITEARLEELRKNKQFSADGQLSLTFINLKPFSHIANVFEWLDKGESHLVFIAPVAGGSLYILIDLAKKTILAPYILSTIITTGVLLGITLLSCFITMVVSILLSKTLRELSAVMDKISAGDLTARYRNQIFGFELNEAGQSLNKMLDRLVKETNEATSERLKTEMVTKELKIGRKIQSTILPQQIPKVSHLEIGVFSESASDLGGNFYDFYDRENRFIITLASTARKGLSSCLYSLCLRSILRCFATSYAALETILEKTNQLFHQDIQNTSISINTFLGSWDSETGTLHYSSGNPSFGFVRLLSGEFHPLSGSKIAMGAKETATFTSYSITLPPGSIVVLYTIGVIEQQNKQGELFGENGLKTAVNQQVLRSASEIAIALGNTLIKFTEGVIQEADMTIIVLKVKKDA